MRLASSMVEKFPDMGKVIGSIPCTRFWIGSSAVEQASVKCLVGSSNLPLSDEHKGTNCWRLGEILNSSPEEVFNRVAQFVKYQVETLCSFRNCDREVMQRFAKP